MVFLLLFLDLVVQLLDVKGCWLLNCAELEWVSWIWSLISPEGLFASNLVFIGFLRDDRDSGLNSFEIVVGPGNALHLFQVFDCLLGLVLVIKHDHLHDLEFLLLFLGFFFELLQLFLSLLYALFVAGFGLHEESQDLVAFHPFGNLDVRDIQISVVVLGLGLDAALVWTGEGLGIKLGARFSSFYGWTKLWDRHWLHRLLETSWLLRLICKVFWSFLWSLFHWKFWI